MLCRSFSKEIADLCLAKQVTLSPKGLQSIFRGNGLGALWELLIIQVGFEMLSKLPNRTGALNAGTPYQECLRMVRGLGLVEVCQKALELGVIVCLRNDQEAGVNVGNDYAQVGFHFIRMYCFSCFFCGGLSNETLTFFCI